ncbi:related to SYG1 protein [Phialocephala subalpina]|uniref:Related to SYG1 protein n=1 Tax=Phialocephala subalpina TaxID=576137 RepID=A0A1L7XT49_9HELO|nr:related to SYG1 protein [Phialocephala subalpina]
MKFAKELEQDLVPEWRIKYLDYKAGKKRVKAVRRAFNRMNATPRTPAQPNLLPQTSIYGSKSPFAPRKPPSSRPHLDGTNDGPTTSLRGSPAPLGADSRPDSDNSEEEPPYSQPLRKTPPMTIPTKNVSHELPSEGQYGSFVPTPPAKAHESFELPGPALTPAASAHEQSGTVTPLRPNVSRLPSGRSVSVAVPQRAYEVGQTLSPPNRHGTFNTFRDRMSRSENVRPFMRRMFSVGTPLTPSEVNRLDIDLVAVDQLRQRQRDFFRWMDGELDKVETFYKSKEEEAGERLKVLREQLHEMRNRRIEEVAAAQNAKTIRKEDERNVFTNGKSKKDDDYRPNSRDHLKAWMDPFERVVGHAKTKLTGPHLGSNSKALQNMQESPEMRSRIQPEQRPHIEEGRDYVRRPHYSDDIPYRTAKRKLKLALQEFYRGMELLKSYALLNRTAFRKINKKYDKAVDAHPPLRFMSEKVNKAWFVQSDVLDNHLHAVEDLYARYFERGNRKIAVGKLRTSLGRPAGQSMNAFQNGILIGTGAVFAIQGIIYGAELLHDDDPTVRVQTSYLLQIYAGYFLALYLFSWFCLDCSIWTRNKINYQFVFEFDSRNQLDWRQLASFPSFLILLLGLFVWVNFTRHGAPEMYIYYPVILIFLTVVLIFLPAPILFHKSRRWFVYSHWRLLLAGIYPVEFRDFFLGDMYCSLTYMTGNLELFFCLYAHFWNNPTHCNSTHSRLLGFFTTFPGIWRALQCIRRYFDTRNVFPHLVNCGKYTFTILSYVTLSIYRIDQKGHNLAVFILFSALNSIYTSIWDLLMDWSLLQPYATKKYLRDVRGFKNMYWYYAAMILDPILRFNWIFYAIYTQDIQHSTICSFLVAFSEVTRRGMWTLFRVENEHCANVAHFKASRDVPLPYFLESDSQEDFERTHRPESMEQEGGESTATSPEVARRRAGTGAQLEAQESRDSLKRRPTRTLTSIVADAHTQDFEKKRRPEGREGDSLLRSDSRNEAADGGSSDEDDDEDEQDEIEVMGAEELLRDRRRRGTGEEEDGS